MNPIIQTVLDAHFPGVAKPVVMDLDCELTRLRAENTALRERADVRAIVGELRGVVAILDRGFDRKVSPRMEVCQARNRLVALLRRLDESE